MECETMHKRNMRENFRKKNRWMDACDDVEIKKNKKKTLILTGMPTSSTSDMSRCGERRLAGTKALPSRTELHSGCCSSSHWLSVSSSSLYSDRDALRVNSLGLLDSCAAAAAAADDLDGNFLFFPGDLGFVGFLGEPSGEEGMASGAEGELSLAG